MPRKIVRHIPEAIYAPKPYERRQAQCRHKLLNVPRVHCCQCGSRLREGVWEYLNREWFKWYMQGGRARPRSY